MRTITEEQLKEFKLWLRNDVRVGEETVNQYVIKLEKLDEFYKKGKCVSAICAAPSIFGHRGYLRGRNACSYPGFEKELEGAEVCEKTVAVSEHVTTSRGMGTAMDFGLAIVERFCGSKKAEELAAAVIYRQ